MLSVLVACLLVPRAAGSLLVTVYNSTALAGAVLADKEVADIGLDAAPTQGPYTLAFVGQVAAPEDTYYTFGVEADMGYVRLWVDDHLMIDSSVESDDPTPLSGDYVLWHRNNASATQTLTAKYAIPVPFFPSATASRLRLEFTAAPGQQPARLALLANGSTVAADALRPNVDKAEVQYFAERAAAEVGWNTWLSDDMLTHALLPHGLGLSLSFHSGSKVLARVGTDGPKCNRDQFPVTHGLHDTRGEYTELEAVDFAGATYRVESATTNRGELLLMVTLLKASPSDSPELHVEASVPASWSPRHCDIYGGSPTLRAECAGLPRIILRSCGAAATPTATGFTVALPSRPGEAVAFMTGEGEIMSAGEAQQVIGVARRSLLRRIEAFGHHNETYAGMKTAISWLVVYSPLEGIFTPVFRGSPWGCSKPHNYVLFEWDTFFASIIAAHVDEWVAKSNIIRMTKSLIYKGYVAGFWNGVCGEVDKSKPPVGGLALEYFVDRDPEKNLWVADLLIDQMLLWNRWWTAARLKNGMIAPGSTREMLSDPIACVNQSPTLAAACETGLDNSPLYSGAGYDAKFIASEDVIDSVDVGMTALYARDAAALASLAKLLGRDTYAAELANRSALLKETMTSKMWNDEEGIYLNKMWQTDDWIPRGTTGSVIVAPTNFYPMMTSTPNDGQVARMMDRWLANATEFCVCADCGHGLPSISRSSSAFHDNDYWRGRTWGPMNFLVYLGLKNYPHIKSAAAARMVLSAQSEATFLVEWLKEHRVMENFNSVSGVGCDVDSAVPFYHWGALNALIPLLESGLLDRVAVEVFV